MERTQNRLPVVGVLVALLSVAAITGLVYALREIMPAASTGVLYMLAVLLVSSHWGLWLGLATSVASAPAFNFSHIPPTVLVTIAVPPNAPVDADVPQQEARAASTIDSARVRGGRRVTGHWTKVRPGQAGRRIVEEAREIRARAVVMSLPPRRAGMSLFGKTLESVLAERPCRVIIASSRGLETGAPPDPGRDARQAPQSAPRSTRSR